MFNISLTGTDMYANVLSVADSDVGGGGSSFAFVKGLVFKEPQYLP